jgi:hypothetical protein
MFLFICAQKINGALTIVYSLVLGLNDLDNELRILVKSFCIMAEIWG